MANDFKRFAVTNVNTSAGASASAVYSVPAGAGSSALESIVIGITIANTSTAGITANVFLDNNAGSNDVHIVKNASIPAGSSLEVMSGNKLFWTSPANSRSFNNFASFCKFDNAILFSSTNLKYSPVKNVIVNIKIG